MKYFFLYFQNKKISYDYDVSSLINLSRVNKGEYVRKLPIFFFDTKKTSIIIGEVQSLLIKLIIMSILIG